MTRPSRWRAPAFLISSLDAGYRDLLTPGPMPGSNFSQPAGEAALVGPASVAWRVFRNPMTVFIGGVAAVILELAEPSVREGVWRHTSFRTDPRQRLQRTGLAAMVTVYGARSVAETMIARVRRTHERVRGETPDGRAYRADDVRLLNWVQATASFGFVEAHCRHATALSPAEIDRYYREGLTAARLYGAIGAPESRAEQQAQFDAMHPALEPSDTIFAFLRIISDAPLLPRPLRPFQRLLVRAAVDVVPPGVQALLGIESSARLGSIERAVLGRLGRLANNLLLPSSPAVQACRRLGLADDHLYRRSSLAE